MIYGSLRETVPLLQLRPLRRVSFTMAQAEVLSDKGSVAVGKITSVDLFWGI